MFPGSISIHFLLSMGMILDEEPAGSFLCGFAFAFDRFTKSFACSNPSQIYLIHEKF